jgi:hypothetical protein
VLRSLNMFLQLSTCTKAFLSNQRSRKRNLSGIPRRNICYLGVEIIIAWSFIQQVIMITWKLWLYCLGMSRQSSSALQQLMHFTYLWNYCNYALQGNSTRLTALTETENWFFKLAQCWSWTWSTCSPEDTDLCPYTIMNLQGNSEDAELFQYTIMHSSVMNRLYY